MHARKIGFINKKAISTKTDLSSNKKVYFPT